MGAPSWSRRNMEKKKDGLSVALIHDILHWISSQAICFCCARSSVPEMWIQHVHAHRSCPFLPLFRALMLLLFAFVSSSTFCVIVFFLRIDRRIRRVLADYFTWWFIDWYFARVFLWTGDDGSTGNAETVDDRAAGVGHAVLQCCLQGT